MSDDSSNINIALHGELQDVDYLLEEEVPEQTLILRCVLQNLVRRIQRLENAAETHVHRYEGPGGTRVTQPPVDNT